MSDVKVNKASKIDINFKRTCSCPDYRLNCLTPKEWVKNQVAIWEFFYEKRDIRDKDIHPAVFPIALPKKCIELFIIIWDKRKLVNKVGIYGYPSNYITFGTTFEYILDFWRTP